MRIISQDGTIDIPYEQCVIQRFKQCIYFLNKNLTGVEQLLSDMEIATYSTEEKAEKAMEMLHKSYIGMPVVAVKDVEMDVKMITDSIRNGLIQPMPLNEPKVECDIFQFPQDEDVEV